MFGGGKEGRGEAEVVFEIDGRRVLHFLRRPKNSVWILEQMLIIAIRKVKA